MTVSLTTQLRGPTPFGTPVEIAGRLTRSEGRKHFASGEVRVPGEGDAEHRVSVEATAVFVDDRGRG